MSRKFVWDGKGWVEPGLFHARKQPEARSALPAPMVRADGMGDTWNPADGNTYDSKSAYYRAVEDAGCVIDESPKTPGQGRPVGGAGEDIKQAIEQLEAST